MVTLFDPSPNTEKHRIVTQIFHDKLGVAFRDFHSCGTTKNATSAGGR
jgi:hypothetical protein